MKTDKVLLDLLGRLRRWEDSEENDKASDAEAVRSILAAAEELRMLKWRKGADGEAHQS